MWFSSPFLFHLFLMYFEKSPKFSFRFPMPSSSKMSVKLQRLRVPGEARQHSAHFSRYYHLHLYHPQVLTLITTHPSQFDSLTSCSCLDSKLDFDSSVSGNLISGNYNNSGFCVMSLFAVCKYLHIIKQNPLHLTEIYIQIFWDILKLQ